MASVSTERHPDAEFFGHGCLRESASVGGSGVARISHLDVVGFVSGHHLIP